MQEKNKRLIDRILRIFCDPVLLYSVLVLMSIMYHYRSQLTVWYGLLTLVFGAALFVLFDFMQKRKLLGGTLYIAVFAACIWLSQQFIDIGQSSYPISWGVWFLTPQDALDYNKWYTLAIYVLFAVFMLSVIYYFTRVRYRIFMNFLILLIPFSIYGKEYEKMPTLFIILLCVGYILLMVKYRTLSGDGVKVVSSSETWRSVAAYAVVFAVAAAVVPKPEIEADRTMIETMINADQFTDRMLAMLNVFRDTTSNENYRNINDNTPIYFVQSSEGLHLKLASYSQYYYSNDSWSTEESDTRYIKNIANIPSTLIPVGEVLEAVSEAAWRSDDFADKYDLHDLGEFIIDYPEEREITIYTVNQRAQFAPVPQFATELTKISSDAPMALINSGLVYNTDGYFSYNESYTFKYREDTLFADRENREAEAVLCRDDYEDILTDALEVLDDEYEYAFKAADEEDFEYLDMLRTALRRDLDYYTKYASSLLDYSGNQRIKSLSDRITEGCETDFEKAKAIESYFYNTGFSYDPNYIKGSGANAETFLFESQRGVCYEYATAMVLLARAAGIPARFCEGYNMSLNYKNDRLGTNMVVTNNDAHAYPELYIRGAGWMSFEPTVGNYIPQTQQNTTTQMLSRAGIMMFAAAVLLLIAILLYPTVSHKIFLMLMRRRDPDRAVRSAMLRLCRIYGIESVNTSREAAAIVEKRSGADILPLADIFDKAEYGGGTLTDSEKALAEKIYIAAYAAYRQSKRKKRRAAANS